MSNITNKGYNAVRRPRINDYRALFPDVAERNGRLYKMADLTEGARREKRKLEKGEPTLF